MPEKKKKKINSRKKSKPFNIKRETTGYWVERPTLDGEARRMIRVADWDRIKRKVRDILQGNWLDRIMIHSAVFFLGVAITSFIGLMPLDRKGFEHYSLYLCVAIFSLILSVILFLTDWQKNKGKKQDKEEIETDMEEIEKTFGNR